MKNMENMTNYFERIDSWIDFNWFWDMSDEWEFEESLIDRIDWEKVDMEKIDEFASAEDLWGLENYIDSLSEEQQQEVKGYIRLNYPDLFKDDEWNENPIESMKSNTTCEILDDIRQKPKVNRSKTKNDLMWAFLDNYKNGI